MIRKFLRLSLSPGCHLSLVLARKLEKILSPRVFTTASIRDSLEKHLHLWGFSALRLPCPCAKTERMGDAPIIRKYTDFDEMKADE